MARSKSNSYAVRKNTPLLIAGLVLLVASLLGGAYYLYQQKNLSSENASAGTVRTYKLDDYTLSIEKVAPGVFSNTKSTTSQWKYSITGETQSCYQDITVTNTDPDADAENPVPVNNDKPVSITLKLVGTRCTAQSSKVKDQKVVKTGTFLADDNRTFNFNIYYEGITPKTISNTQNSFVNRGFTLTSTEKPKATTTTAGTWTYNVTGNSTSCYTPATFVRAEKLDPKAPTVNTHFKGAYVLRFLKNANTTNCDTKVAPVSLTKSTTLKKSQVFVPTFIVKYVTTGVLLSDNIGDNIYKSGTTVMKLTYTAQNTWFYEISGQVPSACYELSVTTSSNKLNPETVTVSVKNKVLQTTRVCPDAVKTVTKTGTITASKSAKFVLNTGGTTKTAEIISNGITLTYSYTATNTWTYTVTGNVPSACYELNVTHTVSGTKVAVVAKTKALQTVRACADVVTKRTVTGTVTAPANATFTLNGVSK